MNCADRATSEANEYRGGDQWHRVGLAQRIRRRDRRHGSRGTVTAKSEPASSSPVVPCMCHKQRFTSVANG